MNRFLHWFNLLGVIALATLCILQWRANRLLNLELNRQLQLQLSYITKLDDHSKTAASQDNDLSTLRTHLARLSDELKHAADNLAAAQRDLRQSIAQRDQLKSSVTNWAAALAARDDQLKQTATQLKNLANERNDAVEKFNDLARQHNTLVKKWNELQKRLTETSANAPPTNR